MLKASSGWGHANRGIINGVVACFVRFCAFLCVSVLFFPTQKWPAKNTKLRRILQKCAKKRFYATPPLVSPPFPLVTPPFCVSPTYLRAPWHRNRKQFFESQTKSQGISPVRSKFGHFHRKLGCTPRGSCNNTLLRRVLRRFSRSKCFLEGFLEGLQGPARVFSRQKHFHSQSTTPFAPSKSIATATVSLPQKNRLLGPRIWTSLHAHLQLLNVGGLTIIPSKKPQRTVLTA